MEALFFVCDRSSAFGVRSEDDLPGDSVGAALPVPGLKTLRALATALDLEAESALGQLRDATCQSFPIWALEPRVLGALLALDDSRIDEVGKAWLEACGEAQPDADLHEISLLLEDLRTALQEREDAAHELFVLLEEKAF